MGVTDSYQHCRKLQPSRHVLNLYGIPLQALVASSDQRLSTAPDISGSRPIIGQILGGSMSTLVRKDFLKLKS